jgi:hypothetical protein
VRHRAPLLGEHTRQELGRTDLSQADLEAVLAAKAAPAK